MTYPLSCRNRARNGIKFRGLEGGERGWSSIGSLTFGLVEASTLGFCGIYSGEEGGRGVGASESLTIRGERRAGVSDSLSFTGGGEGLALSIS